jgi:hypothetical protein
VHALFSSELLFGMLDYPLFTACMRTVLAWLEEKDPDGLHELFTLESLRGKLNEDVAMNAKHNMQCNLTQNKMCGTVDEDIDVEATLG